MEKQPASAAPISSSGFVPLASSKRDENEYRPSNAPLPSFIVPLPCFSVPSHTADPVRVAIVLPPLVLFELRFAPDMGARNLFWVDYVVKAPGEALATSASTNSRRLRRCHVAERFGLVSFHLRVCERSLLTCEPEPQRATTGGDRYRNPADHVKTQVKSVGSKSTVRPRA